MICDPLEESGILALSNTQIYTCTCISTLNVHNVSIVCLETSAKVYIWNPTKYEPLNLDIM